VAVAQISSLSVEYLKVPITSPLPAAELDDLPVELAVVDDGKTPVTGDWKTGLWIGTKAAVLIGPAATITLTPGTYDVYVRITATPEKPVLPSGSIHIT
jgi:hypothetical protein